MIDPSFVAVAIPLASGLAWLGYRLPNVYKSIFTMMVGGIASAVWAIILINASMRSAVETLSQFIPLREQAKASVVIERALIGDWTAILIGGYSIAYLAFLRALPKMIKYHEQQD